MYCVWSRKESTLTLLTLTKMVILGPNIETMYM
jgi:hypothetical protein